MEPVKTLYEREVAALDTLPPLLATSYDGGFVLPVQERPTRPYVIANFVETLDGVVSYNIPGETGSGPISGDSPQDKMVMGLLRASADAVVFGSSSLRQEANHLHIPSFIYPSMAADYAALRVQQGRGEDLPISVIMSASGQIDLNDKTFHTPGLRAIIATTEQGSTHLSQQALPNGTEIRIIETDGTQNTENKVSPEGLLQLLARDYGVRVVLYEGGPTLLASFLSTNLIDELFLTVAPQLVGRDAGLHRLSLVEGHAFTPAEARWSTLLSVKLANSHLLLRYKLSR